MADWWARYVTVLVSVGVFGPIIAGIALIVGTVATVQAAGYDPDVVTCGNEEMTPFDTCFEEGDRWSESQSRGYLEVWSDQRDDYQRNRVLGPVGLWTAGVCGVLGLAALVVGRRELRRPDGSADGARRQEDQPHAGGPDRPVALPPERDAALRRAFAEQPKQELETKDD